MKNKQNDHVTRRVFIKSTAMTVAGLTLVSTARAREPGSSSRKTRPGIGLALGSGGAAGLAHIPILQVFDDLGVKPSIIAGSSIGAIIGALYASGLSGKEIRELALEFSGSDVEALKTLVQGSSGLKMTELLRSDLDSGGLLDSRGFLDFLETRIRVNTFEELPIPLIIAAADYWKHEQVVLETGRIIPAVKASMAVPGLFAPVAYEDRLLVDGGTVNPLPYDLLQGKCDIIVAVDVSGVKTGQAAGRPGLTDSLFNTFEIMQQSIIRQQMKWLEPDIYLKPEIRDIRLLHFHRAREIFEQAVPTADHFKAELVRIIEL